MSRATSPTLRPEVLTTQPNRDIFLTTSLNVYFSMGDIFHGTIKAGNF